MKQKTKVNNIALSLPVATLGTVCGLIPMFALERTLHLFSNLQLLLFSVYFILFLSMFTCLAASRVLRGIASLPANNGILRLLLLAGGAVISFYWHLYLNPVPVGPAFEAQIYTPLLMFIAILILAWAPFVFLLKKKF